MKKFTKVLIIFIMLFSSMLINTNIVNANDENVTTWTGFSTEITTLDNGKNTKAAGTAKTILGTCINVIRIVGTGVAIIMLTYVAIKYMSAAPSEKAEFKKSAVAYIVGAVILFATTNILSVISNFATTNIKT